MDELAADTANSPPSARAWQQILAAREGGELHTEPPWQMVFAPLVASPAAPLVIGQLGQSLDGRIATPTGHSHYINGEQALAHLHRLRALVDAVVVGIGTVLADDPQLTVRHVAGPSPARIVIDPRGRLPAHARLLAADGRRRVAVTLPRTAPVLPPGVEQVRVAPAADGRMEPATILAALGRLGFRRVLIEGGAATLSRFLAAGCLHRLHVAVAPLIIGSGPTGLTLPPVDRLGEALRPPMQCYRLGGDLLFDVELARR